MKKIKKFPDNKANLRKMKYQKRALLRRISRRKNAETEIIKTKKNYHEQKAFNKNPNIYSKKLFSSQSKSSPNTVVYDPVVLENPNF